MMSTAFQTASCRYREAEAGCQANGTSSDCCSMSCAYGLASSTAGDVSASSTQPARRGVCAMDYSSAFVCGSDTRRPAFFACIRSGWCADGINGARCSRFPASMHKFVFNCASSISVQLLRKKDDIGYCRMACKFGSAWPRLDSLRTGRDGCCPISICS